MPRDIFDANAYQGEKLEYWAEWQGMKFGVVIRRREDLKGNFVLSIVSPFFNVNREIVGIDVLREMDKIYQFLKYQPEDPDEQNKMGQDRGAAIGET